MNPHDIEGEIKAVLGNEAVFGELEKLLESGEAIALVGAGTSAGLWPLWNEFLQGFIGYSLRTGKVTKAEADFFLKMAPQTPLETAQQLRNKIGEPLYFEYLQETFSDRISPQTDGAFTLPHQALMQLPIRNYLTLNYDAGLTNARAALYPKATTSYYFWDQEEAVKVRDRRRNRHVLYAHGRYDRADSIILTLDDYRRAYDHRAFVRLLEDLFVFEKLLIVGFGMGDPYIKQLFNNIRKDYKRSPLRHIAFIGLEENDKVVTHLLRERVEMVYGSRILFYPARNHHQALTEWLTILAERFAKAPGSRTAEEIRPLTLPPKLEAVLPDRYIHKPTDDAYFKGRSQNFATLNRWGNDPATKMVAITGIGGQGKTALVGRWLKQERDNGLARMPVFYWSFYEDLDVKKFLEEAIAFCLPIVHVHDRQEIEPVSFMLGVVKEARLLLVLDGLEVLQEEESSPAYGKIDHPLLQQFLRQWMLYDHHGLMILTSRFRFTELARFSGAGFHHTELVRLSTQEGIALLETLGLRGKKKLLEIYVERLHGHPLALRVLASTVKRCCFGDLSQFEGKQILKASDEGETLSRKLSHLLDFYERHLGAGQKELLGVISLFKRPVKVKSLITLVKSMSSLENILLSKAKEEAIERQIDLLIEDFLVERTPDGITTHPVIRDYFRAGHRIAGSRQEVAEFLWLRPGRYIPENIEEVRDIVESVQLLCDEGNFCPSNVLYLNRLVNEGASGVFTHAYDSFLPRFNVFRDLPAVAEGLECNLAFVGDEVRRQKLERQLGKKAVAFYFSGVSLFNT